MNKIISKINEFCDKGYYMFPTYANDKKPCVSSWGTECTNDVDELQQVFAEHPELNLAIVTGRKSGLFVIDVDTKNGHKGIETLTQLEKELGSLPNTYTVKTPNGGYHYYFNYPSNLLLDKLQNKVNIADGLDIRADGGYVLTAPSVLNGKEYKVINDVKCNDIPIEWINYIYSTNYVIDNTRVKKKRDGSSIIIPLRKEFQLPDVIEDGSRNDTLLRYACHLLGKGIDLENISKEVETINNERCVHPLRPDEIENTIMKSVGKYHQDNEMKRVIDDARTSDNDLSWLIVNKGSYNIDELKYAKYFIHKVMNDNIFYFMGRLINKYSEPYNEEELQKDIANEIGEFIPSNVIKRVSSIMELIKRECIFTQVLSEDEKIELYSTKSNRAIRFNKETKKYEVFEVTDEVPRVNTINVNFTEDLLSNRGLSYKELKELAPYFHKWITDLMDTEERDILQEFLGYSMTASTKCQMALQIEGDAGLGKSRVYDILSLLIGKNKISSYDLTSLEQEQYLLPVIFNKLVIYDDDIKVQSLKDTGVIKTLITSNNEPILARQIYGAYHEVPVYAKILACGNHMLSSLYDRSDGLWRRFILLTCKPLDSNRQEITYDIFLKNFKKELPYIFLWCLDGLERLINNNWKFSHQDLISAKRELLKANSDSVFSFFNGCKEIAITQDKGDIITKKELYAIYCDYCDLYDLHPLSIKSFSKEVNAKASKYGIIDGILKINRKSERIFRGIAIVENAYEEVGDIELQTMEKPARNNIIKFSS